MPCWTLDELQLVGAYMVMKCRKLKVDSSPEAIKEWYHGLGGILRYVLPNKESIVLLGKNDKLPALNKTKLVDVLHHIEALR